MRSSRSNEKSVFRIAGHPHSGPAKLARQAKGPVAFNGERGELIIRNSAGAKIPQPPAPRAERNGEKDGWTATSGRQLLSAIPPTQKSTGTFTETQSGGLFSFLSFSRCIRDQLSAIDDDDTNGRVMEIHVNPSGARALGHTDWKYLLTKRCATRAIDLLATPAHENYTNLAGFHKNVKLLRTSFEQFFRGPCGATYNLRAILIIKSYS